MLERILPHRHICYLHVALIFQIKINHLRCFSIKGYLCVVSELMQTLNIPKIEVSYLRDVFAPETLPLEMLVTSYV